MNYIKSDLRNRLTDESGVNYVVFKATIYKLSIRDLWKNTRQQVYTSKTVSMQVDGSSISVVWEPFGIIK
jgi:predicted heme/steroid binding protein